MKTNHVVSSLAARSRRAARSRAVLALALALGVAGSMAANPATAEDPAPPRERGVPSAIDSILGTDLNEPLPTEGPTGSEGSGEGMESRATPAADVSPAGDRYLAEVVDSVFRIEPAEFFALDLPANPPGARAIHLSGTVNVADPKGDIIVRLFREPEYQNWLKKRGGSKAAPYWISKRSRSITLDQDLPRGVTVVLLLDNGFSVRTPKRVRTQLQIQYERVGGFTAQAPRTGGAQAEEDFIQPRANTEEEIPPPPPPPPADEAP